MSKKEYFHNTPRDVDIFITEMSEKQKAEYERENEMVDYRAWLHGLYVQKAIGSALNGRKSPYPKQPFMQKDKNHIVATEDMSQEEKDRATQLLFGNLEEMQKSFELSHKTNRHES